MLLRQFLEIATGVQLLNQFDGGSLILDEDMPRLELQWWCTSNLLVVRCENRFVRGLVLCNEVLRHCLGQRPTILQFNLRLESLARSQLLCGRLRCQQINIRQFADNCAALFRRCLCSRLLKGRLEVQVHDGRVDIRTVNGGFCLRERCCRQQEHTNGG